MTTTSAPLMPFPHVYEALSIYEQLILIELAFPGAFRGLTNFRHVSGFELAYRFTSVDIWHKFSRYVSEIRDKHLFPSVDSTLGGRAENGWVKEVFVLLRCTPTFSTVHNWYKALHHHVAEVHGRSSTGESVYREAQRRFQQHDIRSTRCLSRTSSSFTSKNCC